MHLYEKNLELRINGTLAASLHKGEKLSLIVYALGTPGHEIRISFLKKKGFNRLGMLDPIKAK